MLHFSHQPKTPGTFNFLSPSLRVGLNKFFRSTTEETKKKKKENYEVQGWASSFINSWIPRHANDWPLFFFGRKKVSGAATTPRGNFARIDLAMRYFGEMFLFSPFVTRVSHQWHTPRDVKTSTTWGTGVKCHAISWRSEELTDVLLHSVRTLNVNFIGRVLSATFWGIIPWIGDDEQELF